MADKLSLWHPLLRLTTPWRPHASHMPLLHSPISADTRQPAKTHRLLSLYTPEGLWHPSMECEDDTTPRTSVRHLDQPQNHTAPKDAHPHSQTPRDTMRGL